MERNTLEVIERMIEAAGLKNSSELARHFETSPSTIANWKKRDTIPYKEVYEISRQFGVSMDWILNGVGDPKEKSIQLAPKESEFFQLPHYSVEASAGNGSLIEAENIDQHLAFRQSWVKRLGLKSENLIAIYARGDSMEPTIFSGDTLVIDKSMNTVTSDGGIYVINYDGELFVKRVQKQLNGTVAITSDNKNYGDIVIASADLNTLKIIGRVIWSGHPMI